MTAITLPLSNVINVSITNTPTGLTTPNVNSVAILSDEIPVNNSINLVGYAMYVSYAQVISDWGVNSITAQMAENIFGQSPNILAGGGILIIVPMLSAVSATPGNVTTASIVANLTNLQAVTNGDLKVTLDAVAHNLANLNFTSCQTLADIANVIQSQLVGLCTVTANATEIIFTNNKVGIAASVALAAYSGGGLDLTGSGYLNTSAAATTAGVNSTGETVQACIARISPSVFFCSVMTNLNLEDTAVTAAASAIQALDMMFFHHFAAVTDIAGIITTITSASQSHTRPKLYTPGQAAANLMKAAWVGREFSTDYTGSNTCGTMNLQLLANVNPDPGINETYYLAANAAGADLYVSYFGVPACYVSGGNNYDDVIYGEFALKFALETNGYNYLAGTNTKIPQTEPAMSGYKNSLAQVMNQFVVNGFLAPGTWTSPDTFGNQQLFLANIQNQGYYIFSQPVGVQPQSQRAARVAPLVQIAAKLAGAIQSSSIQVLINA